MKETNTRTIQKQQLSETKNKNKNEKRLAEVS